MLKIIAFISWIFVPFWVAGQENSYKRTLSEKYPGLLYSYIDSSQTHDYSGNWDLDGDGKKDGVLFVGNGGAHLFFHLRLVVGDKVWNLKWVEVDMPMLGEFVVDDFDGDGRKEVYIRLGKDAEVPKEWRKKGVKVGSLEIKCKEKQLSIRNFISD